jgi:hypothetical protein
MLVGSRVGGKKVTGHLRCITTNHIKNRPDATSERKEWWGGKNGEENEN